MDKEIWVLAEHEHGEIREASLEMLGEACRLAKNLNTKVCALLFGNNVSELAGELFAYGADTVFYFDNENLKDFDIDLYLHAIASLDNEHSPLIVLVASTPNGASFAPRVAAHLKFGFAANMVTTVVQPDGSLLINRSSCLNKAHATYTFPPNNPVVITIKPGSVGMDRPDKSHTGNLITCNIENLPSSRTAVTGFVKADPRVIALDEAERVIAGGCGFHSKEDLELIRNLSELIGAAVGGSKPMFDKGWLPHSRMVGQSSGRRLSPSLFVGVGISGTNYFIEGMKDSRLIVAINSDKGAPLMRLADLAVAGDLYEVLPELTKQISERQKGTVQL